MWVWLVGLAIAHLKFSNPAVRIVRLATVPYCLLWHLRFFWVLWCLRWWGIDPQYGHSNPRRWPVWSGSENCQICLQLSFEQCLRLPLFAVDFEWEVSKRCLPRFFLPRGLRCTRLVQIRFQYFWQLGYHFWLGWQCHLVFRCLFAVRTLDILV